MCENYNHLPVNASIEKVSKHLGVPRSVKEIMPQSDLDSNANVKDASGTSRWLVSNCVYKKSPEQPSVVKPSFKVIKTEISVMLRLPIMT